MTIEYIKKQFGIMPLDNNQQFLKMRYPLTTIKVYSYSKVCKGVNKK